MKSFKYTLAFSSAVLLVSFSAAYADPQTSSVLNGTSSSIGRWPWMASLSPQGSAPGQEHFCGGVLIDSTHVLTAAHCLEAYREDPEGIQVTLGKTKLSESAGLTVRSTGLIIHPDYDQYSARNDIGIIQIEKIGVQDTIAPVSFAQEMEWSAGNSGTILGWGYMDPVYPVRPDNLQQAQVPVISDETCAERIGIDFDSASMMCAGQLASAAGVNDGIDSCNGDSGGPLVVQTSAGIRLAGIVSWGFACGSEKYWGVYTKVAKFYDWIVSNPPVAPFSRVAPDIHGRPEINNTLTCQKGEWGGDGPFSYTYQWLDSEEGLIRESSKPSYRLGRRDIGRNLTCAVIARSKSAETTVETHESGSIFPPFRKTVQQRLVGGIPSKIGTRCDKKQCQVLLTLKSAGVKSITAVTAQLSPRATDTGRSYRARQVTGNSWTLRLPASTSRKSVFIRFILYDKPSQLIEVTI